MIAKLYKQYNSTDENKIQPKRFWHTKKAAPWDCLFCCYIISKGESEMVFTTCIYNNIGYEYKTPHNIDTNSYLFILIFMLHCMLNFSKRFIKISHEFDEK